MKNQAGRRAQWTVQVVLTQDLPPDEALHRVSPAEAGDGRSFGLARRLSLPAGPAFQTCGAMFGQQHSPRTMPVAGPQARHN